MRFPKYGVWISAPACSISPAVPTMAALPNASISSTPPRARQEPIGQQPGQHRGDLDGSAADRSAVGPVPSQGLRSTAATLARRAATWGARPASVRTSSR